MPSERIKMLMSKDFRKPSQIYIIFQVNNDNDIVSSKKIFAKYILAAQVTDLLREFDLDVTGNLSTKRRRLRLFIGIVIVIDV